MDKWTDCANAKILERITKIEDKFYGYSCDIFRLTVAINEHADILNDLKHKIEKPKNKMPSDCRRVLIQIAGKLTGAKTWHIGEWNGCDWHIEDRPEWFKYARFVKWQELPKE